MLATNRQRRALLRSSLIFAGFAALAVVLGVPARAYELQQFHANDEGQVEFVMPSGNIGCIYTPAGGEVGKGCVRQNVPGVRFS